VAPRGHRRDDRGDRGALFRAAADQAEQLWQPLSPEEYEAAIRAATEHRRGGFRSGVASMSFAATDDDEGDDK
jgi:hypothetical protein